MVAGILLKVIKVSPPAPVVGGEERTGDRGPDEGWAVTFGEALGVTRVLPVPVAIEFDTNGCDGAVGAEETAVGIGDDLDAMT